MKGHVEALERPQGGLRKKADWPTIFQKATFAASEARRFVFGSQSHQIRTLQS
jgi:hypothetical protein